MSNPQTSGLREQQVIQQLLQGRSNAEIGKELKMAKNTVKSHMNRLFLRYGINDGHKRVRLAMLLDPQWARKVARISPTSRTCGSTSSQCASVMPHRPSTRPA